MKLAIAFAALLSLTSGAAAETQYLTGGAQFYPGADNTTLNMVGVITEETPARLQQALWDHPETTTIELLSSGGALLPALKMGWEINFRQLGTRIADGNMCLSACAYMFLGGVERDIEGRGELGVHNFWSDEGLTVEQSEWVSARVTEALDEFGADPALFELIAQTSPETMHVLSAEELARYGIERGEELPVVRALQAQ